MSVVVVELLVDVLLLNRLLEERACVAKGCEMRESTVMRDAREHSFIKNRSE